MYESKQLKLLILIFLYTLSFFTKNQYIAYVSILLIYLLILFSKILDSYLCAISTIPCMGVFDNIGITTFYNVAFVLFLIRLLIYYIKNNKPIRMSFLVLFLYLNVYNLAILFFNNLINVNIIINSIGFFTSTMVFSLTIGIVEIKRGIKQIYYWMFYFIILSFILGAITDILKWGFPLPEAHRLVGLMRDANYFSSFTAITTFSFFIIFKKIGISPIILTIVGLLTVSKMFLLIILVSYIYLLVVNFNKMKILFSYKLPLYKAIFSFVLCIISLIVVFLFSNYIMDKYFYRLTEYTLTTGRSYIWSQYFQRITRSISGFFFGKSLSYSVLYSVQFNNVTMVAHNTFFDILLSFGVINFFIIFYVFVKYFTHIKYNKNDYILLIILFIIMSSLSWLMIDNFFYLLLYISLVVDKNTYQNNRILLTTKNNIIMSQNKY